MPLALGGAWEGCKITAVEHRMSVSSDSNSVTAQARAGLPPPARSSIRLRLWEAAASGDKAQQQTKMAGAMFCTARTTATSPDALLTQQVTVDTKHLRHWHAQARGGARNAWAARAVSALLPAAMQVCKDLQLQGVALGRLHMRQAGHASLRDPELSS